jgi:uncharacterized protein YqgC (DUF456 family)
MVEASLILLVLAALLVAAGLAGLVLPLLPGAPLLFAGLFMAAWAEDFAYVGPWLLALLGLLALVTYAVDLLAGAWGVKRFGASGRAATGAALGMLVGLFLGPVGIVAGPFLGAVAGELSSRRGLAQAGRAGLGATLGLAMGAAAKLALGFTMLGTYLLARLL